MNQKVLFAGAIAIVVIGVLLSIGFSTIGNITLASNSEKPLRIGWMTSWTEPGLVVEALKNTDILARNNAIIETPSFSYGPAIVEATLSNKVDAPLLGSLPAINILANSDNFTTVGRLADFEQFIIVGKDSEISSVFDLKGKKIGVPFATGPHLSLLRDLEKKELILKKTWNL
jgi:ABC-type nitrate/sulfonate/bicarbonate transport system substrate-binding protein